MPPIEVSGIGIGITGAAGGGGAGSSGAAPGIGDDMRKPVSATLTLKSNGAREGPDEGLSSGRFDLRGFGM